TLGSDLAGVVVEVGNHVTRFKPGDAVLASVFDLGTGTLAEFAVVPENVAALKPANLDFVQAASIPMVGLTSWQALKERAKLQPGHKMIDKVFPFGQVKEALAYLEKGRAKGKVVVQIR